MKHLLIVLSLLVVPSSAFEKQTPPGFATYLLGFMTRARGQLPAGTTQQELQKAHVANLNKMWEEGMLVASGPIGDAGDLRGVLIFVADARSAVERRVGDDPLVRAGFLKIALTPWMGPSGIGAEYKKWAAANPGAPDKMRTYQLVLMKSAPGSTPMTEAEIRAHLVNMNALAARGKLAVAGPVLEPSEVAGVFVFLTDAAEAETLAASDPATKSGKLVPERHPWMVAEGVLPHGFKVLLP